MSTDRRAAIRSFVYTLLTKFSEYEPEELSISDNSPLTEEELGVDSLNMVEVIMSLEAKFNIEISDDVFVSLTNVGDLIVHLDEAISENYRFDQLPQLRLLSRA